MQKVIYQITEQSEFHETLPFIISPCQGESLYGYLLRLDHINGFASGTILRMIKKHSTGLTPYNRPGLYILGTIFNLQALSVLVNVPYDIICDLTLSSSVKRLFRIETAYPSLIGYSNHFKICPKCIEELKMPLIHVFQNISICLEHNIYLSSKCSCGNRIVLFSPESHYSCCPNCDMPYKGLPQQRIEFNSREYVQQEYFYYAYIDLIYNSIDFVNQNETLAQGFEDRLQQIVHSKGIGQTDFKKLFGFEASKMKNGHGISNLSLSKIVEMLYVLGYSPVEFRDIKSDLKSCKIHDCLSNKENDIYNSTCPNIYCKYYNIKGNSNIKYCGRRH